VLAVFGYRLIAVYIIVPFGALGRRRTATTWQSPPRSRQLAAESVTLPKNDGGLLPISRDVGCKSSRSRHQSG